MLESKLRSHVDLYISEPITRILTKNFKNIHPNHITIIGLLFGCISCWLIINFYIAFAIGAIILSGLCDLLDGNLARSNHSTSPLGTTLDLVSDRIVESAIILGLFLIDPIARAIYIVLMFASILICVTCFLALGIVTDKNNNTNKSFNYTPALMERAEAFIFFILMLLLPNYFNILAIIFICLVIYTTWQRIRANLC